MPTRQLDVPRRSQFVLTPQALTTEPSASATRIGYPGGASSSSEQSSPSSEAAPLAIFSRMRDKNLTAKPTIPLGETLESARVKWALHRWYTETALSFRIKQLKGGKIKQETLQKERQSLRCWQEWDKLQKADDWPPDQEWHGLPVWFLAPGYFESWAVDRIEGGLAVGTVRSRWSHLRVVLNMARHMGAIDKECLPKLPCLEDLFELYEDEEPEEFMPTAYTDEQLQEVYHKLEDEPDMQTAWVLGAATGPRTVDLFSLRWRKNVSLDGPVPELFYKAKKTGKWHWVPLAPCVVWHLRRLQASQENHEAEGLLFPRLTTTAEKSRSPEKTRPARRRTDHIKAVLASLGMNTAEGADYAKPWQVLRATCNTRLNNHTSGVGILVTHGKDADVSSMAYWNERPRILEAVLSLKQPAAFERSL